MVLALAIVVGVGGLAAVGVFALFKSWTADLPSLDDIASYSDENKTRILAADGTVMAEFYEYDRQPTTSDKVTPYVFEGTVAVEDERYFQHGGVDYYGIARAFLVDLTSNHVEGASTITQQLIRQTVLQNEANDMSYKRKVREATLAVELEQEYSKEDILMMYLNTINYGDGSWGIESAAEHYYSKSASELTLAEAATLCGIPQSPEYNNPVTYPDNALARRNTVLDRMYANGYISEDQMNSAKAEGLDLNVTPRSADGIYMSPFAVAFVRQELQNNPAIPQDMIFKGGLTVQTSIDLNYEKWAEDACEAQEAYIKQYPNGDSFEVGLTCVDPTTGLVKCIRGGKDFYVDQWSTSTDMHRQAGSSFKAFGLAAAIEKGFSPQTMVSASSKVTIQIPGAPDWNVQNYNGNDYGTLTLAQATWKSSNTAYARVVRTIGPEAVVEMAQRCGITSPLLPVYSAILGSNGVNTMEMASAFGTFANDGKHNTPTAIVEVTDKDGNVLYQHTPENTQVISGEVAYATTQVLEGVIQYGTATAAKLSSGQIAAGKTGTADNWKDAWFIGYTPQLSTAVWIGSRYTEYYLPHNEGGVLCAPVWNDFMSKALAGQPLEDFKKEAAPTYDSSLTFMTPEEKK
ncbi:MAG: PBP1A family penicillin-binding protein, partial [Coriobacteriia bacterium]|nr:PBP1A family penicillin-binding protein [Coriobacteriia bacterium]